MTVLMPSNEEFCIVVESSHHTTEIEEYKEKTLFYISIFVVNLYYYTYSIYLSKLLSYT